MHVCVILDFVASLNFTEVMMCVVYKKLLEIVKYR